jgi:hypothetical protein
MKTLLATLLSLTAAAASAQIDYQFDDVRRKVTLNDATPIVKGQHAKSGDEVETGWFSYAKIASSTSRAKFEIFSGTSVRLADGTAGVILAVERGRIRAAFDKITGTEPRVVKTPGALLAVRGTQFDVEVDASGNTIVDVFEGLVEVQSPMFQQPMFVRPGEQTTYGRRGERPSVHPMPEERRQRGPEGQRDRDTRAPRDGKRPDDGSMQPRDPRDGRSGDRPAPPPKGDRKPPE